MGRHKQRRVREWLRWHYYGDRSGIWPRIRAAVERNGGVENTKLDIMALMVWACLVGMVTVVLWVAVNDALL